jgi:hypothetical protein
MRTAIRTLIALVASTMPALAAGQFKEEGGSLMIVLFFGFGALIMILQLFPGLALFTVTLKEIFTGSPKKGAVAATNKAAKKL